jgi:thioredoxin-like negative regulator of GroEL
MKVIIEVNQSNFQSEVLESNQPVIVNSLAEPCGPYKMVL